MPDTPRRRRLIATLAVGSFVLVTGLAAYLLEVRHRWSPTVPGSSHATFVDDRSCAQCHQAQYRAWVGSHHERAMQRADEHTVLGDFKRSEEHTSELQSRLHLVCRLLLEKKKERGAGPYSQDSR